MTDHVPYPDESSPNPSQDDALNPAQSQASNPGGESTFDAYTLSEASDQQVPAPFDEPDPTIPDLLAGMPASSEAPFNFVPPTGAQVFETPVFPDPQSVGFGAPKMPSPPSPVPPNNLSPQDERTYAMLAHLSILLNLFTGFLGPIAALIIYLVYKDRSHYVAFQSMQAFVFQLIAWIGAGIIAGLAWTISGVLAAVLVGCLLMPCALLISFIPFAALVYGVIGAVKTNSGQDFRYWLIGDMVKNL